MKKTVFGLITMLAFFAFSCNNAETTNEETTEQEQTEETSDDAEAKAGCCKDHVKTCDGTKTVDYVLANFEDMTEEEVSVCGKVTHVCVHSGKRIFLAAEESEDVIVVTSEEKFSEDLMGQKVVVTGKIALGEVEHDHDVADEDHIEDDQHKNAHAKTFVIEASNCKTCVCDHEEE